MALSLLRAADLLTKHPELLAADRNGLGWALLF
jgi:hypothetical protein